MLTEAFVGTDQYEFQDCSAEGCQGWWRMCLTTMQLIIRTKSVEATNNARSGCTPYDLDLFRWFGTLKSNLASVNST